MTVDFLSDDLISRGFKYFLIDNIENANDGNAIIHYVLIKELPNDDSYKYVIALNSENGSDILLSLYMGDAVVWIDVGVGYQISSSGRLSRNQKFQKLII